MNRKNIVKLVLTVMTIYFAVIPITVDVGEGHLFNPEWTPHSKIHLVWFLLFTVLMAGLSLYLLWFRDEILATSLIGLSFNSGFVFAYFTAPFYGGVLPSESSQVFSITDIPPNLAENFILGLIFLGIAIYLVTNFRGECAGRG
ncbi:hypothetical protein KFU94_56305 [Chloroflexi bacterium TSY]|nr:hypothetical protein [Chloroflexi bacterium TSY]